MEEINFKSFIVTVFFLITDQHTCWHYEMKTKVTAVRGLHSESLKLVVYFIHK